ncbi:MAG: alpha/beta hydrolase family protein [Pseudomonadota bacterium]
MAAPQSPHTFVLVHGAWHGGWCWRLVADILRSGGHRVITPTLTGMGERHHLGRPETDCNTHVMDVLQVLKFEDVENSVLVGHSYGGPVVEGVYDKARGQIAKIVMLDATVLYDGESMLFSASPEAIEGAKAALIDGFMMPSWPQEAFGVLKEDGWVYDWVKRRLTPMPFGALTAPLKLTNPPVQGPDVLYITCDGRPLMDGARMGLERAQERGWSIKSLKTGHDAMVTAPAALADMLLEAA